MRLTQERARTFELPEDKSEIIVFDDQVPGFGLRVRRGGSRNWIVQYKLGSRHRRMTLGSTKLLNAEKARRVAQEVLAKVRLGEDPQALRAQNREAASDTFYLAVEPFIRRQESRLRKQHLADTKRYLLNYSRPLHDKGLKTIERAELARLLGKVEEYSGATTADRMRAVLSAFFTWAVREGYCDVNPVLATNRAAPPVSRERVLSDREVKEIWDQLPSGDFGKILKLLFLTGQRREEIGGLRWNEINFDREIIILPASRTKNKRPHEIPLSDPALEILLSIKRVDKRDHVFGRGEAGFQGYSRAKRDLDRILTAVEPWRIHDIRRTVATKMAELGVQPHIIEAVLNHVSGYRSGVAGVYNRAAYSNEKREALSILADNLPM